MQINKGIRGPSDSFVDLHINIIILLTVLLSKAEYDIEKYKFRNTFLIVLLFGILIYLR